jgi:hypothetical protein
LASAWRWKSRPSFSVAHDVVQGCHFRAFAGISISSWDCNRDDRADSVRPNRANRESKCVENFGDDRVDSKTIMKRPRYVRNSDANRRFSMCQGLCWHSVGLRTGVRTGVPRAMLRVSINFELIDPFRHFSGAYSSFILQNVNGQGEIQVAMVIKPSLFCTNSCWLEVL